jgi:hypothetical protein
MKNFNKITLLFVFLFTFISSFSFSQQPKETVKSSIFDNGKMWTFDYPPVDYFTKTYKFTPAKEWLDDARLSSTSLGGCSSSFISEDGLVLTNHHCARRAIGQVTKEKENLAVDGFYAPTLADERKIPGQTVSQLQLIEDVTEEVKAAFESGKTGEEKVKNRTAKIEEIQKRYNEKTKLSCNVISFYNGGKYSVYGYKVFRDVRMVFAVETQTAFYGGDPDNYVYPRYDLDMAIYRVYDDDGKPLKVKNFYKWSKAGAKEDEMVFVVGYPGRTNRLRTVSQLEFNRDFLYKLQLSRYDKQVEIINSILKKQPERKLEFLNALFGVQNMQKRIKGYLDGLLDPKLMARKRDFENNFKTAVLNKSEISKKYGKIWDDIEKLEKEKSSIYLKVNATSNQTLGLSTANNIITIAKRMKNPEDGNAPGGERRRPGPPVERLKENVINSKFDVDLETGYLAYCIDLAISAFGENNSTLQKHLKGQKPDKAAADIINATEIKDKEKVKALLNSKADDILGSKDPLISFLIDMDNLGKEYRDNYEKINDKETPIVQMLGNATYDVFGTQMPPDANSNLRIADGIVKGYEYNGTIAPPITTFYGLYDKYYSHQKEDWDLAPKWKNPPSDFKLNTPFNFVSTCDIIGGNSGSPVINKDQEIVGLVFDGNMESLPGDFIFLDEKNRTVAVHSAGILEALEKIYKANRLVKELKEGKMN